MGISGTELNPGLIEICYKDDGLGMDSTVHDRIFEPFFTTRRGSGGSGLGLYIVYNLVTSRLGGIIACQSEPNQGTSFTLRFPVRAALADVSSIPPRDEGAGP
ncbi:MAG: HAMP domain-containing sensor histidine kinase [Rhodospirillaceae bacterium]